MVPLVVLLDIREAGRLLVLTAPLWRALQHRTPLALRNKLVIPKVRVAMASLQFECCTLAFFFFFGKPNLPNLMSLDGLPITLGSVLATLPLSVSINANMAKESCMPQTCEVTPGMSVQWELSFLCLYCKALSLHVLGLPFPLSSPSQKFWIIPWPALTGLFPVTFSDSRIPDSCESLGNLSPCTRGWILYVINLCSDLLVIGLNPYGITACWQCPHLFDINK